MKRRGRKMVIIEEEPRIKDIKEGKVSRIGDLIDKYVNIVKERDTYK